MKLAVASTLLIQAPLTLAGILGKSNAPEIIDDLVKVPFSESGLCLGGNGFYLTFEGECNYDAVVEALTDALVDLQDPDLPDGCPHDAAEELRLMFGSDDAASAAISQDCDAERVNHASQTMPWADVTAKGADWDKEYYDGKTYWNEEYETLTDSTDPDRAANVLKEDADRVKELYEGEAQRSMIEFPEHLPNFESCELRSVMCCWPSDRQANDNNGNCKKPYDTNCVDADPADNTDLCAVDMSRSGSEHIHVDGGFATFGEDEGPIHCHGFAWGMDDAEADARYKANNLFYVSMYDHMYQRGYVRNVPGAPMCGCVEKMPLVTRSDCTEISEEVYWKFTWDSIAKTSETIMEYVDIDFNACQGLNNRNNNNLEAFYQRLVSEGRATQSEFRKFRQTVVGRNNCHKAVSHVLINNGYELDPDPYLEGWNMTYGKGMLASEELANPSLWEYGSPYVKQNGHEDPVFYIRRLCVDCRSSHQDIIYKRLTPLPEYFDVKDLFLSNWFDDDNVLGTDFNLFSTFEDALTDSNAWTFCNYNDLEIGFPRDCGPNGKVNHQWNSLTRGGRTSVSYYVWSENPTIGGPAPEGETINPDSLDQFSQVYGKGTMKNPEDTASYMWTCTEDNSSADSPVFYVKRICESCHRESHKEIVYKRLTPIPEGMSLTSLFTYTWSSSNNILNQDFELYDSMLNALRGVRRWSFCNYDDTGVGFPRDCGPRGFVGGQWGSGHKGQSDFAFYLYNENPGLEQCEPPFVDGNPDSIAEWSQVYGKGSESNADVDDSLWSFTETHSTAADPVFYVRRLCPSCSRESHQDIIYKRLTPLPEGKSLYDLFLVNWFSQDNVLNVDFELYSSATDAILGYNKWVYCNYNDASVGFPRDCGPYGYVPGMWGSYNKGQRDFGFYVYNKNPGM